MIALEKSPKVLKQLLSFLLPSVSTYLLYSPANTSNPQQQMQKEEKRKKKGKKRAKHRKEYLKKNLTRILENLILLRRQPSALGWSILPFEVIGDLLHGEPLDAVVRVYVLDNPFAVSSSLLAWAAEGEEERRTKREGGEIYRSSMRSACGCPLTSGWMVTGKTNSSYSR